MKNLLNFLLSGHFPVCFSHSEEEIKEYEVGNHFKKIEKSKPVTQINMRLTVLPTDAMTKPLTILLWTRVLAKIPNELEVFYTVLPPIHYLQSILLKYN